MPPSALAALRRKRDRLLDQNPILWLAGAGVWQGRLVAGVVVVVIVAGFAAAPDFMRLLLPVLVSYVLPYLLALSIASHATQFFVQMRQQGALEFLLSTPLTDAEILRGQWLALRRRYLPMAIVILCMIWLPGVNSRFIPASAGYSGGLSEEIATRLYLVARSIALWFAAGWAGIYFGLHARRTQFAGLQAMLVSTVIPWMLWCIPEILPTFFVAKVCSELLRAKIRRSITAKLESGQAL